MPFASGCYAQAAPGPADAAYGTVPGKRIITPQNELGFEAEPGFPPGVFAVPLNVSKAVAFDTDGTGSGVCSRIDEKPFELNGNVKYYKFRCEGLFTFSAGSRPPDLLFVASTDLQPKLGEKLE